MLLRSHGRYTKKQVDRCAKMCGPFGKEMDRMFGLAGLGSLPIRDPTVKSELYAKDMASFMRDHNNKGLFTYSAGRKHDGFSNFRTTQPLKDPVSLGVRLKKYSKDMDFWKRPHIDTVQPV